MVGILPLSLANSIFGALLIAACLTSVSLGAAFVQFYNYMTSRYHERPFLKWIMAVLMLIMTVHVMLVIHISYYYLVLEYGNPESPEHVVWSITANNVLMELINCAIRLLFARRVWLLSQGNSWVTVLAALFSVGTFAVAGGEAILLQKIPNASLLTDKSVGGIYEIFRRMTWSALAINIAAEFTLTTAMCYYLYNSRTGFKKTNSLIATFMMYTIHTGLFILVGSTISTICYLSQSNGYGNYSNIFYWMESSLYVNAYLAMLSARDRIRDANEIVSLPLTQITPSTMGQTVQEKPGVYHSNNIHVAMTRSIQVEEESPTFLIGNGKGRS